MELIVKKLEAASAAYYNTDTPLMSDAEYDELVDQLRTAAPDHPFLTRVGAPPVAGAPLPYKMQSLDKVKPGTKELTRFLMKGSLVLSDKLDGISGLWIGNTGQLFLRGDDTLGTDVSHVAARGICGLVRTDIVVRGELIVARNAFDGTKLVRNWVNGILHRDSATAEEIGKIHFVAYEILACPLSRAQQFVRLRALGFEVPWWLLTATCTEEALVAHFSQRRRESPYETDGIVVAENHPRPSDRSRPQDVMAFKMAVEDEILETTIQAVLWATSAQGYLIPRLQIEPVEIHGARIEFCTAHNAKFIQDNLLGPGAVVRIKRSGDVIPCIHAVVTGTIASMPSVAWDWDKNGTHAIVKGESAELQAALMTHFVKTLEIVGCGEGQINKLVGVIPNLRGLLCASAEELQKVLGKKTGASLAEQLVARVAAASEKTLMIASRLMPRGVGDRKLSAIFAVEADPRRWSGLTSVTGWTKDSLDELMNIMPAYETWRLTVCGGRPYPILERAGAGAGPLPAGVVVFTGFRDADLVKRATQKGFVFSETMTKKTTVLVVSDTKTQKAQKAHEMGIEILEKDQFIQKYLS